MRPPPPPPPWGSAQTVAAEGPLPLRLWALGPPDPPSSLPSLTDGAACGSTPGTAGRAEGHGLIIPVHFSSVQRSLAVEEPFGMPGGAQIANLVKAAVL